MKLYYTDSKQILGAKLEQIRVEHINYCFYFPSEHCKVVTKYKSQEKSWDFPGGPVVNTPYYQCIGHRFNLWWGHMPHSTAKKKRTRRNAERFCSARIFYAWRNVVQRRTYPRSLSWTMSVATSYTFFLITNFCQLAHLLLERTLE